MERAFTPRAITHLSARYATRPITIQPNTCRRNVGGSRLRKYYESAEAYRVVKELGCGCFVVVKIMKDYSAWTVKFWQGDLTRTESEWTTRRFSPSETLRARLSYEADMLIERCVVLCNVAQNP